jgi:parvulin-like peptidyl-prolyl isomerase
LEITYLKGRITQEEVIKFLLLTGQSDPVFLEIIKKKESLKEAKEIGIEITDEELQQYADHYRIARGLYNSDEMTNFLENSGLTEEDFEEFCETSILIGKVKDHLAPMEKVEEYFINNRQKFDRARISIVAVKEEDLANEIKVKVLEEGEDFHKLAREHSLDPETKYSGGYRGSVYRRSFPPDVSAKVFNGSVGDVLGPFKYDQFFKLIFIEELIKPELNIEVQEVIKERIVDEWLSQFQKGGIGIRI